jgi:hypothetical protein
MRLGDRMRVLLRKSPAMFRGAVLHEMAHIANGDVGRAYFAQSLWATMSILLLAPTTLTIIGLFIGRLGQEALALTSGSGSDLIGLVTYSVPARALELLQVAGLLALFTAIRGSLLRTREIYADWRAGLWGAFEGLEAIFRQNQTSHKSSVWSRLWRLHPAPDERLRLLKNPRSLFSISTDLPLLVGAVTGTSVSGFLALTILLANFMTIAQTLLGALLLQAGGLLAIAGYVLEILWSVLAALVTAGPFFVLGYLTAGTLGLQAQRDGVAATAMHEKRDLFAYTRLLLQAALFSLGLQIGFVLAPVNFFAPIASLLNFKGDAGSLLLIPFWTVLWIIFFTLLVWVWLAVARATASQWITRHTGAKSPNGRRRFLTIYLAAMLWLILVPMLIAQALYWDSATHFASSVPFEVFIVVLMIALGLAAGMAVSGLLLVFFLSFAKITCPACRRKTKQRQAVGRSCEHCGADLAPWIIAQPRTV